MSVFNKIRFWVIDRLVGDASYIRNVTFYWNENYIGHSNVSYWSNVHTNGNPDVLINSTKTKLSETMLVN